MISKQKDWSAFAADFEKRSAYVVGKSDLDKIGEKLAEYSNLGKSLELGCGPGVYTGILADKSDSVLATDISEDMINAATERLIDRPDIKVEQADCFKLGYPDNSFDTVFMANLLHVIPEPEKAIEEARRVLKQDGRIIAASLTGHGMKFSDKMRMFFRYLKTWGGPPPGGTIFTVEKLERMLEASGFSHMEGQLIGDRSKSVFVTGIKIKK